MSFLSHIVQSIGNGAQTIRDAGSSGSVFGNSYWGKVANNATGVRTSANLIRRGRQGQRINQQDVIADAGVMRPGQSYTQASGDIAGEASDALAASDAAKASLLAKQTAAEDIKARGQVAVRARRRLTTNGPANKNGTVLTSPLGVPSAGASTLSTLLGL